MLCIEYENQKNTLQSTFINDVLSWGYTHLLHRLRIADNIQGSPQKSPSFCLPPKQLSMSGWDGILVQGVLVPLYPALTAQRARPHDNSLPVSVVLQSPARQHEAASLVITGTNVEIFIQLENWLESNDEDNSLHDPCVYYNISISLR